MGALLSGMGFAAGKWVWAALNFAILIAIILILTKGVHSFVQSNRRSQDMAGRHEDVLARLEAVEERLRQLEEKRENFKGSGEA